LNFHLRGKREEGGRERGEKKNDKIGEKEKFIFNLFLKQILMLLSYHKSWYQIFNEHIIT